MDLLVTGGAGYIGSATARLLQERGHRVTVVDDLSEGHRAAWPGELAVLDLRRRSELRAFLEGRRFDGVLHFAARAYVGESVEQPERYWHANLVPLIHLAEALPGLPFVFSSTCATYGLPRRLPLDEDHPQEPVNPYGATKAACERLLRDRAAAGHGPCALLRYFNACGADPSGAHGEDHRPETHLLPRALQAALGRLPEGDRLVVHGLDWDTPDGSCVRDWIHVLDLAEAHVRALEHLLEGGASGAWNLGTGRGHSVLEILRAVEEAAGAAVPWEAGPRRPGDPPVLVADPTRAARELGWEARHSRLEEIVGSALRWHREHPEGYGPAGRGSPSG